MLSTNYAYKIYNTDREGAVVPSVLAGRQSRAAHADPGPASVQDVRRAALCRRRSGMEVPEQQCYRNSTALARFFRKKAGRRSRRGVLLATKGLLRVQTNGTGKRACAGI